jgi:hypothetical protein
MSSTYKTISNNSEITPISVVKSNSATPKSLGFSKTSTTKVKTPFPPSKSKTPSVSQGTSSTPQRVQSVKNKSVSLTLIFKILLFLFILALIGVNVFEYLGLLTKEIKETVSPILYTSYIYVGNTAKVAVNTAATGAKLGVDVAAGTVNDAINLTQGKTSDDGSLEINATQEAKKQKLKNAINTSTNKADTYIPDNTKSKIQQKATGKSGFCYIGEDRGFRQCLKVSEQDVCVSGDIFPTNDICVNPNLREGMDYSWGVRNGLFLGCSS